MMASRALCRVSLRTVGRPVVPASRAYSTDTHEFETKPCAAHKIDAPPTLVSTTKEECWYCEAYLSTVRYYHSCNTPLFSFPFLLQQ